MLKDIVSRNLKLWYEQGRLNPSDINEEFLKKESIVDDENLLDRSQIRIGSLGSNFIFTNGTKDEIKIQPTIIEISSKLTGRIELITNGIRKNYPSLTLLKVEFVLDDHYLDPSYPDIIFEKYKISEGFDLDAIQFKNEGLKILMHSCGIDRIHIKSSLDIDVPQPFSSFEFYKSLELEWFETQYKECINKLLLLE